MPGRSIERFLAWGKMKALRRLERHEYGGLTIIVQAASLKAYDSCDRRGRIYRLQNRTCS